MLLRLGTIYLSIQIVLTQNRGDECVIQYTNSRGVCSPASRCQSARQDFQNKGIVPTLCKKSEDKLLVCCRDQNSILKTGNIPTRRPTWGIFNSNENENLRLSERKCTEYNKGYKGFVEYIPLIPGGEATKQGEFPHMAAIGWINDFDDSIVFQCGGSLISPRFVLSAGHCIWNPRMRPPQPSIVRLGDQNLDPKVQDRARPIDIPIGYVHKHPNYKAPGKYDDIALFELRVDVNFGADIRPSCLWTKHDFGIHNKAIATGWGVNDTHTNQPTNELQKVSLSLLENDYCDKLLEDIQYRHWKGFRDTQMCAGELSGGKDTCQGDSGSPLQVTSLHGTGFLTYVVGITSFGYRCAEPGRPAVYTRVSSYLDWIESVVWPE